MPIQPRAALLLFTKTVSFFVHSTKFPDITLSFALKNGELGFIILEGNYVSNLYVLRNGKLYSSTASTVLTTKQNTKASPARSGESV